MDLSRNEVEHQGLKLDDIGAMVVQQQQYIKHIYADSTLPFDVVRAYVRAHAEKYFNLVLQPNTEKALPKQPSTA